MTLKAVTKRRAGRGGGEKVLPIYPGVNASIYKEQKNSSFPAQKRKRTGCTMKMYNTHGQQNNNIKRYSGSMDNKIELHKYQ